MEPEQQDNRIFGWVGVLLLIAAAMFVIYCTNPQYFTPTPPDSFSLPLK